MQSLRANLCSVRQNDGPVLTQNGHRRDIPQASLVADATGHRLDHRVRLLRRVGAVGALLFHSADFRARSTGGATRHSSAPSAGAGGADRCDPAPGVAVRYLVCRLLLEKKNHGYRAPIFTEDPVDAEALPPAGREI